MVTHGHGAAEPTWALEQVGLASNPGSARQRLLTKSSACVPRLLHLKLGRTIHHSSLLRLCEDGIEGHR